ncbi:hypothetical protein OHS33_38995 (plasmid) [Streptomyces sp. NBC_00536]|uniref:hypothetical protein n=1 Tax=Streptomyces sp. NBC_00536 TaxID=2975769 RepID=UPI002E8176A5|nr:hypothetical protein [Streptomyces sp. NBC_00536]WUC84346.1 hypothetical protein OHS33_38995 [Streptomyces sp. NBC_00536]
MTTALDAITAFLNDLEERRFAPGTRRLRGRYLTEYLEHALNAEGTPATLSAAELMELPRVHAWLEDAAAGLTRARNTLRGPDAPSAEATGRSRVITYNVFAEYLGTPWRLEVPPNTTGEHLDPDEAQTVIHTLAVKRPNGANAATSIRTAALAALVAATGRTVRNLARLRLADLQLDHRPAPRLLLEDGPVVLDIETVDIVRRWLRQRAGITSALDGTDPGHLWIATKPGGPHAGQEPPPPGLNPARVRTLHDAHRRLVLGVLGTPLRPGALRTTS